MAENTKISGGKYSFPKGEDNPAWKGGKSIASNGYVLIRVGLNHHLADNRGYAYEHRVVAENMLGRKLKRGELVHHKDGNRANNNPENLDVKTNQAEHLFEHRSPSSCLRMPNEDNPFIECACGCGAQFTKYDRTNRPRKYVSGHNPGISRSKSKLLEIMGNKEMSLSEIGKAFRNKIAVKALLSRLCKEGSVIRVRRGIYRVSNRVSKEAPNHDN